MNAEAIRELQAAKTAGVRAMLPSIVDSFTQHVVSSIEAYVSTGTTDTDTYLEQFDGKQLLGTHCFDSEVNRLVAENLRALGFKIWTETECLDPSMFGREFISWR